MESLYLQKKYLAMIQRLQSVFLFLSAVSASLLFFVPIASFGRGNEFMFLSILGVENQVDNIYFGDLYALPLLIVAVLMIIVPIVTIFLFKKRELQLKLSSLNVFINAIFCGLIFLYYASNIEKMLALESISYNFGSYIPLINMVLSLLAMRWIKKDIDLIKSVDRLR